MNLIGARNAPFNFNTIGFKCGDPTNAIIEPIHPQQQMRIMLWRRLQEQLKHAVMVALQCDPVFARCLAIDNSLNDTLTFCATVHIIPDKHNRRIRATIRVDTL